MPEKVLARLFHCLDCEVGWIAGPACFCCGNAGTTGSLSRDLVEPVRRTGWSGPLSRPASHRTTVRRTGGTGGMSP
jgi:hypothetical protein